MIIKTKFKNLVIIQNKKHKDKRGYFQELAEKQLNKKFISCNVLLKEKCLKRTAYSKKKPREKLLLF